MGRLAVIFASGFGVGYIPVAPGTFGSLWGIGLFWLARNLSTAQFIALATVITLVAVFFSHFAEKQLRSHDSAKIIIDEIAGYLVTVIALPFSWTTAGIAFILFRLFDIWKPFPIRQMDRKIPGAWGVVLDDVMAGVYAHLVLRMILIWLQ